MEEGGRGRRGACGTTHRMVEMKGSEWGERNSEPAETSRGKKKRCLYGIRITTIRIYSTISIIYTAPY